MSKKATNEKQVILDAIRTKFAELSTLIEKVLPGVSIVHVDKPGESDYRGTFGRGLENQPAPSVALVREGATFKVGDRVFWAFEGDQDCSAKVFKCRVDGISTSGQVSLTMEGDEDTLYDTDIEHVFRDKKEAQKKIADITEENLDDSRRRSSEEARLFALLLDPKTKRADIQKEPPKNFAIMCKLLGLNPFKTGQGSARLDALFKAAQKKQKEKGVKKLRVKMLEKHKALAARIVKDDATKERKEKREKEKQIKDAVKLAKKSGAIPKENIVSPTAIPTKPSVGDWVVVKGLWYKIEKLKDKLGAVIESRVQNDRKTVPIARMKFDRITSKRNTPVWIYE